MGGLHRLSLPDYLLACASPLLNDEEIAHLVELSELGAPALASSCPICVGIIQRLEVEP